MDKRVTFGSFELVDIPILGIKDVVAKVDTGAYSGAVHCVKVQEAKNTQGKRVLRLQLTNKKSDTIEINKFITTYAKSSSGSRQKRYLFDTKIVINNKEYPIRIGVSNRSGMNYQVLIGRRFLNKYNILVDVRVNQDMDIDREKKHENSDFI